MDYREKRSNHALTAERDTVVTPLVLGYMPLNGGDVMATWIDVLAAEFALPHSEDLIAGIARLGVAAVLGGVIGWEREQKGRAAGLKTHILVATGSALFVLTPLLAGIHGSETTRVMQGIVSGIGLLGAGAIIRTRDGTQVEGMTTAASIWMTAAIGMTAGMGLAILAILATALSWGVVAAIPHLVGTTPAHQGNGKGDPPPE